MFVEPAARGRGHGRRVLVRARGGGGRARLSARLRLDTAQSMTTRDGAAVPSGRATGATSRDYNGNRPKALVVLVERSALHSGRDRFLDRSNVPAEVSVDEVRRCASRRAACAAWRRGRPRRCPHRGADERAVGDRAGDVGVRRGEDVEPDGLDPVGSQRADQPLAQVSGAARDEDLHGRRAKHMSRNSPIAATSRLDAGPHRLRHAAERRRARRGARGDRAARWRTRGRRRSRPARMMPPRATSLGVPLAAAPGRARPSRAATRRRPAAAARGPRSGSPAGGSGSRHARRTSAAGRPGPGGEVLGGRGRVGGGVAARELGERRRRGRAAGRGRAAP